MGGAPDPNREPLALAFGAQAAAARARALDVQSSPSSAIGNTDAEVGFNRTYTAPADTFAAGDVVRIRIVGSYSSTGAPTLTLRLKFNGVETWASYMPTTVASGWWVLDVVLAMTASSFREVFGTFTSNSLVEPVYNVLLFNPSNALEIAVTAEWSAADPLNTTTQLSRTVELLKS